MREVALSARRVGDQFVLLACDGVWDVMSSPQAFISPTSRPHLAHISPISRLYLPYQAVAFVASLLERAPAPPARAPALASASYHPARAPPAHDAEVVDEVEEERLRLGGVVERLLDECLRRGSTDNMSAVLVILDPNPNPNPNPKP